MMSIIDTNIAIKVAIQSNIMTQLLSLGQQSVESKPDILISIATLETPSWSKEQRARLSPNQVGNSCGKCNRPAIP